MTESRSIVLEAGGRESRLTTKEHEENLGSDGNVLYDKFGRD